MKRIFILPVLTILALAISQHALANSECDSILRDGTMAHADIHTNDFLRRILHWRFGQQDVEKSKRDTSFGADIPIYDVLVGVDFSENEASDVRRAMNQSLDKDDIEHHTLDYMLSSGDREIARAWSKCIASSSGLFVWFSERKHNSAVLNVQFQARENPTTKFEITEITLSALKRGTKPLPKEVPRNKCLYVNQLLGSGSNCKVELALSSGSEALQLVVNGHFSKGGVKNGVTAFLPSVMKWHRSTDYLDSRLLNPPVLASVSQNYWNSATQSSAPACITPKEVQNATFVHATAAAEATVICPGDGQCQGNVTEITDEKFCWGAVIRTKYSSCTCSSAGKITLLRSRWVDEDELEPVPSRPDQLRLKTVQK